MFAGPGATLTVLTFWERAQVERTGESWRKWMIERLHAAAHLRPEGGRRDEGSGRGTARR
jgi:hypothetical protein